MRSGGEEGRPAGQLGTTNVDSSDHFLPASLACPLLATLKILDQEHRSEVSYYSSDTIIEPPQAGPVCAIYGERWRGIVKPGFRKMCCEWRL